MTEYKLDISAGHPKSIGGAITRQLDGLFDGKLSIYQFNPGYRFSVDSVLLAHFPKVSRGERILDLGTGSGVVGLILLYRYNALDIQVTGIERQNALAELARENSVLNGYHNRFEVITGDVGGCRHYLQPETFSLVVANPPFYARGSGRTNSDREAMEARHQDETGLGAFIEGAAYSVKNRGSVVMIYPADRVAALLNCLIKNHIVPKQIQFIYSYPDQHRPAKLVLVQGLKNGGDGSAVLAPLYMYQQKNGSYSKPLQAMFRP